LPHELCFYKSREKKFRESLKIKKKNEEEIIKTKREYNK